MHRQDHARCLGIAQPRSGEDGTWARWCACRSNNRLSAHWPTAMAEGTGIIQHVPAVAGPRNLQSQRHPGGGQEGPRQCPKRLATHNARSVIRRTPHGASGSCNESDTTKRALLRADTLCSVSSRRMCRNCRNCIAHRARIDQISLRKVGRSSE